MKMLSAPASSCFFQPWIKVGCTSNLLASSLTVRSSLRAAKATWALNPDWCLVRFLAMGSPFLGHQYSLTGGPVFGVHYNSCARNQSRECSLYSISETDSALNCTTKLSSA